MPDKQMWRPECATNAVGLMVEDAAHFQLISSNDRLPMSAHYHYPLEKLTEIPK